MRHMAGDRRIRTDRLRRVLFTGYYGARNAGDDVFGVISVWGAKHYWQCSEAVLFSDVPLRATFPVPVCLAPWQKRRLVFQISALCEAMRSSAVVFSGGSIFHSEPRVFGVIDMMFRGCRIARRNIGAIGVSLGPFATKAVEASVREQLCRLAFLVLRDRASYEMAMAMDLPYPPIRGADLALLLPRMSRNYCRRSLPARSCEWTLGVAPCHYERYTGKPLQNEQRREKVIEEALSLLVRGGFDGTIRLFELNGDGRVGDRDVIRVLANVIRSRGGRVDIRSYSPDPVAMWRDICMCDAMLAVRLHGAVLSMVADIPCLLSEYHIKCSEFLTDLGVPSQLRVGDLYLAPTELAEKLISLFGMRSGLYPNLPEMQVLSESNFTAIADGNRV
jgi:polysaccharide pyruvyl transferase WcaK-like protein